MTDKNIRRKRRRWKKRSKKLILIILVAVSVTLTALKLLNVISIPWIWVFSPLWISFTLSFLLMASLYAFFIISSHIRKKRKGE